MKVDNKEKFELSCRGTCSNRDCAYHLAVDPIGSLCRKNLYALRQSVGQDTTLELDGQQAPNTLAIINKKRKRLAYVHKGMVHFTISREINHQAPIKLFKPQS